MKTTIRYGACRENLGADTTNAQYRAFKSLALAAIETEFPDAVVEVNDSGFCNASTCEINQSGPIDDDFVEITRDDVEQAVASVGEGWWDAE